MSSSDTGGQLENNPAHELILSLKTPTALSIAFESDKARKGIGLSLSSSGALL